MDPEFPPPLTALAEVSQFADGSRMPAYVDDLPSLLREVPDLTDEQVEQLLPGNQGVSFGQSEVVLRGVDDVVAEIRRQLVDRPHVDPAAAELDTAGTGLLAEVRRTLDLRPRSLTGEGRSFSYTDRSGETRVLHLSVRHHGNWQRFGDDYGKPSKIDTMHRAVTTFGQTKSVQSVSQLGLGVPLLAPISSVLLGGFARVAVRGSRTDKVSYTQTDQGVTEMETRTLDGSHVHLDDAYYRLRVTDDEGRNAAVGLGFTVRDGLWARLPDSVTSASEPGRIPRTIRLDQNSQYRLVRTEGFGPVRHILDWAAAEVGARPSSSAHRELESFFSSDSFHRLARTFASGRVTTVPLFADDRRKTPLGVIVVERVVPVRAVLVGETDQAEVRDVNTSTVRSERNRSQGVGVTLEAAAGPGLNFLDAIGDVLNLRFQFGPAFRAVYSASRAAMLGGFGATRSAGQVKGDPTGLYWVMKTVDVRRDGSTAAPEQFHTWSLDRMTRTEARRLAGWDDGTRTALDNGAPEPFAPAHLTPDRPPTLGMHRVEEFSHDDGLRTRTVDGTDRTLLDHVADRVLRAVAEAYPGRAAPLHELERGQGKDDREYRTALSNTLSILGALSHQSIAGNLEALTTTGLLIRLNEPGGIKEGHHYIRVHGELTGRTYVGVQKDLKLRYGAPGGERLDGQTGRKRLLEAGVEGLLSFRDANTGDSGTIGAPDNALTLSAGARGGVQRERETGSGATATNDPTSVSLGPSDKYHYKLAFTVTRGGHWRPGSLLRGVATLNVLGTQPFVFSQPEDVLIGTGADGTPVGGGPVTGQVLISVPDRHAPAEDPHRPEAPNPYRSLSLGGPLDVGFMSRDRALALATGDFTGHGGIGRTGRGSPAFQDLMRRPFVTVSLVTPPALTSGVSDAVRDASGGSWQLTLEGTPARESVMRTLQPRYLTANADQLLGPLGSSGSGLLSVGPYTTRWSTFRHLVTLSGLRALTGAEELNTEMTLGGTAAASGKTTRTATRSFGGQLTYVRAHPGGTGVLGAYGVVLNPYVRSAGESRTVVRSVAAEMNLKGFSRQVLVAATAEHEFAMVSSTVGTSAAGKWFVPGAMADAAGVTVSVPGGMMAHVAEKDAHALGVIEDGMGEVPRYASRPWAPRAWLATHSFGTYPVNALDPEEVLSAFDEKAVDLLGLDNLGRERVRTLVSSRVQRALGKEMTGGGWSTPVRTGALGWGSVRVGHRSVRVRVELVPGKPELEMLDHSTEMEESRQAVETVQEASDHSAGPAVGFVVGQGVNTGDPTVVTAAPTYGQIGSHRLAVQSGRSTTSVVIHRDATTEPHAVVVTPYRLRITLEAGTDGETSASGWKGFTGRRTIVEEGDVGTLREHVPLSLMVPTPGENDGPGAPDPRLAPPDDLSPGPGPERDRVAEVRSPDTRHGDGTLRPLRLPEEGFHVRTVGGQGELRQAARQAIGDSYAAGRGASERSSTAGPSDTSLTRPDTGPAQALTDGTSRAALTAFFHRALTEDGYEVAGLHHKHPVGTDSATLSLRAKPDFGAARLLAVADGMKMEVLRRAGEGAVTSVSREGVQDSAFGLGVMTKSDDTGLNQLGTALSGPYSADGDGTAVGGERLRSLNVKPKNGRVFLFSVPTTWLSTADVRRSVADSPLGRVLRGTFGNLGPRERSVASDGYVLAWVRDDVARDLGLISDENFPENVAQAWNAVGAATKAWVGADKAYWKKRRASGDVLPELEGARTARRDAETAVREATDSPEDVERAVAEANDRLKAADARLRAAQRAFDTRRSELDALRAKADSAAAELHRVRTATDALTQWHRLHATAEGREKLADLAPPPNVTHHAPPKQPMPPAPARRAYTRTPGDGLVSPDGTRYTLMDVPRDGRSFYHALAMRLRLDGDVDGVRTLLSAAVTDSAHADLLDFVAPDDSDAFSAAEITAARLDLGTDTPARREFDGLGGLLPHSLQLSGEIRAKLAERQLGRHLTADTGWDHAAADLLPMLAARVYDARITVVRGDGTHQDFTGYLDDRPAPSDRHIVLHLDNRHYRPAVPPVRTEQWSERRADAPASFLRLDWFDPSNDPLHTDRAPGTLHGRNTLVRTHIRRIQADDGQWIRSLTLNLPVRFGHGFRPEELPTFQNRIRTLLDTHINHGLRLPRSGDQLHIHLTLTPAPHHAEAIELSRTPDPTRSDQLHIRLGNDPDRDDTTALHEIAHYAGLRDRAQDPDTLFRRLRTTSSGHGLMLDVSRTPGGDALTPHDLRTVEDVLDSGPTVRDHPRTTTRTTATPDTLPPDEHDPRWDTSQAPRDWTTPPSAYVRNYGSQHDGTVGLVHIEPLSADVVDGLHRQIMDVVGVKRDREGRLPDDHPVLDRLRDALTAEELARQLPYLRSSRGLGLTVVHGRAQREVEVRLALRAPQRSARYGAHSVEDPELRVERRGLGTQEASASSGAGTVRTVPVPWTVSFPVGAAGPVRGVDAALSLSLTHNQFSSSATVTQVVQTMTAQRSNELSQPFEFDAVWEVRLGAKRNAPPESWSPAVSHGPVTVWFPEHLAVDHGGGLPEPARLDDLPVWGVDTVVEPGRLLAEVREEFRTALAGLSKASAAELETFLSEPVLRGTLPMQVGGGIFSPVLVDGVGDAIGMLKLTTKVTPGTPTYRSVNGKINLEAHVTQTLKVDSSAKLTSGVALDGSLGPSFTADHAEGHPGASSVLSASLLGKAGVKWQTNASLAAGGSAGMSHAVRSNSSHLLVPAKVFHQVTLIRPRGGSAVAAFGPWEEGMHLRILGRGAALGTEHAPGAGDRDLPEELENLRALGSSAAPLGVTGTTPLFARAETWLREQGFLPPTEPATGLSTTGEATAQARLMNLRRFEQVRSDVGLRASVDAMLDGGHTLHLEYPTLTGTRRVQLRLTALRDRGPDSGTTPAPGTGTPNPNTSTAPSTGSSTPAPNTNTAPGAQDTDTAARHIRTLPEVQTMGITSFSVGGTESKGYAYGWQAGFGGGPAARIGAHPLSVGGSADYAYARQTAHTSTLGSGVNQDQFFISGAQHTEVFEIPARFALDLYEGTGAEPVVRFAQPERHPDDNVPADAPADIERPAEPERPVVRTVEGHLTLAVPHHRTIEKGSAGQTPPPGRTVRLADGKDRARLAMTGPDGTPVPGTVRLPDDAVMDVLHGTGALLDAFHRAVTHTHEGRSEQGPADRTPGSAAYPTGRSRLSRMLFGADPTDQGTTVAEMLRAALSPAALVARAHQILKGGLVVEGLAFNGIGADHEYSVELRGVLHDPEYLGSAKQYLETDVGATDTAARQTTRSGGHQFAGALTLQEQAPKVPDGAPKPGLTSLLNGSARYAYSRRTDDSDTLTSSAGVTRTPTESGALHRIRTGVTFLLTVRHGRRSLITNSLGFGTAAPVTLAVELPRAAQFLLSDAQLARDAKWFTGVPGLTVPERPEPTLLLPDRFARTGQPGLAGVLSVRQFDVDPRNPDDPDRRVEQRDRLGRELTALVEREAPGSTTPGHSSYLPGVLARIADLTMPTSLRALPGRGPDDVLRFHFRHVALGGTRLVEVTLRARPEQDTAGLRTVRGRPAGPGTGQEQVHTHAPANTSNAVAKTRQHAVTANPGTRYPRPADDARTDRTGPAFTFTGTKAVTAKTAASAEDRHWMRTDSAVDADVRYRLEASVRSELVTEWPPQLPGGLLEGGVLAWYDDYADGRTITEWLNRTLHGRPARTVTVPAEVTLRFTGSEAVPSPLPQPPARPTVSETRPTATGGRPLGQRIVPTGPAPVFHFDAYPQLAGALRAVAPRLESTWQSSDASGSAEAVAVRIGELVQAGEIALDPPRAAGLTGTLPGAYPLETGSGAPPTLRISLHNPRRITDTGDVALDRLRLPTTSASTSLTAGTTLATVLQAAYAADDSSRHLVGVGLPLLAQQPVTQGPGSGTAATRREWAKTGGTAQPENQRGVRSHETRTDVVITVDGPAGTRYVSGTAELRLSERDVLGHGITDARTDTQVYDLISMLADRPEPDLRDWTTHPLADLPRALADRLDPQERAAQVWLAPGPDPDGSRLARALYAASRTAVLADRPLELVLRADDGLWHWEFDPTGTLRTGAGEDTVRAAWTGLSAHLATHAEAAHAQADAMRREAQLRADRNGTRTALADAEAALATATAGHGEARAALAEAEAGRTAAETDLTASRREQREREAEIRELPGALLALPAKINEIQRQERAAARDAKTAGSIVQHIDQQPAGSAFPERSRAARERARAADEHLEAVTRDLAALRADQRDFQHRLNAARTATDPVPAREQALTEATSTADGARARLDTATENLARATEHRDTLRDRVPSLGRDIDAALAAQTGHAAVQRAIEPELPRLAHALGTARHASGTGRVSVPLSSLAATPARAPGTAPRTLPHAAPSGEETISREEKAAAVRRAYADFFYARPGSPKFESAYYEFLDTQELTPRARQAATKDRALESMRIFHAQLEKIASDHATEATPIPHTPGEPVRIYRKMAIEEAKVIRGERTATAGLKKALKYNDSKQYRKFFTTSLSHTNVFSNANAASSSEVVVAFTLPWDGYWKFVRQYGTPNQKSGAYEIPHSALIHQERLRTGSAANFREQADVEAVVAGQTHHNIGIGQGNVGDFGRMVTDMTVVPPQEVARADQEAREAAREERRKRAYELVRQKLAQRAAEGGVHGEPFTDGRAGTAAPEAESAEPVAVVEPLRPADPDALVAELLSTPRAELPSRLELLSQGHRRWLASYPPFLDGMRTSLPTEDLARAAARLLTVVPEAVQRPVSARHETYAQVARMLRDPATALRMLRAGAAVVVLPRHVALTGLSSFAELHGGLEPSGRRSVAELRGAADELTAAVPEENLLGERTPIGPVPHQPEGYSSATHEIAHLVHLAGLTPEDQELIGRAFQEKQAKGPDAEWPDGKRRDLADQKKDNYSATNEYEYFAQASTAYLGANHGTDTATGRARNNGPAWVRANEPTLGPLLERLYGPDPEAAPRTPANPVTATDADNARYAAFHDFMTGVEERAATRPTAPTAPAPPAPVSPALVDATAHGEMSMPEPLDRREFVKQAISRPVAGSGHRPPLTVHASEQGTDGEPHNRRMVPDAADLERLRAARTPGDPAYRDGWERLTPSQSWALLAAEERGELFHAPEREAFARRIARLNASARTRYPVDDPERMDAILQAAHDHVRALPIASNQDLAARPDGTGPTRAEALTSDEHFRNFWSTGSTGGTFSRAGRGWVEELQGYGAALRRVEGTPQDGPGTGDFDPPAPDELPKYAALVSPAQHGGTYSYGSAVFYWKDPVRARVTHTPGDSADRGGRGVFSYTDNAHVFPLLAHGEDKRVRLALAEATGFRYDPGLGREVRELGHAAVGRYFETQIHGDLTWADVERIVLNWGDLYASNQRFTTRAEAESMAAFLRAFTTGRGLDLPVELGREIGEPDGAQRLADQRLIRLYDPQDGVGPEERALGEALDRRAARAPFLARATDQALLDLARLLGIRDPDPEQALPRLWRTVRGAPDLLDRSPQHLRWHAALNPPSDSDSKDRARHE
ncbi:hypothetical protein [Streptomyces vulcanius]|uniref:Tox-PL domain-containing protein n=1 Tax=Streptomyces vulcanius TaxID=1441876 RepID=A0ABV9B9H1_9ACTN